MDLRYHTEGNIPVRYILGRMSASERIHYEEHYIDCPICLDRLELTEECLDQLRAEKAHSGDEEESGRLGFRRSRFILVLVVIGLAALSIVYLFEENRSLQHELDLARSSAEREIEPRDTDANKQRPGIQPVGRTIETPPSPIPDRSGIAASVAPQPSINLPVFDLLAASRFAGADKTTEIRLGSEIGMIVLSLDLESAPADMLFNARLTHADDRMIWTGRGLRAVRSGAITIGFPASFFQSGDYQLALTGAPVEGQAPITLNYPFRVIRK